ncbi:MAG: hypothetical protein Fur0024_3280 [Patescibacteria group bacterium]
MLTKKKNECQEKLNLRTFKFLFFKNILEEVKKNRKLCLEKNLMKISYFGHSCFFIEGNKTSLLIDPFDPEKLFGNPNFPNVNPDLVLVTHDHFDHNFAQKFYDAGSFPIFEPGDYEVKGVIVSGVQSFHDNSHGEERGENVIFIFEIDDVKFAHLGDLGHEISSENIDELKGIDVLFVPVGGNGYTIDAKKAVDVIENLSPKIVIPMHYKENGKNVILDDLLIFLREYGAGPTETQDCLKITKKDIDAIGENEKLVILSRTL